MFQGRSLSALLAALFAPETIEGVSCPACAHAAASSALTRSLMALTLKRAALHRSASKQLEGQEDHSSPGNKTESMDMDPQDSSHQALELVDSMSSTLRVSLGFGLVLGGGPKHSLRLWRKPVALHKGPSDASPQTPPLRTSTPQTPTSNNLEDGMIRGKLLRMAFVILWPQDILDRISKCKYPGECSCSSLMEKSLGACLDQIPSSECHPLASLGQELAKAQAWPSSRQQAERRTVIGILPQVGVGVGFGSVDGGREGGTEGVGEWGGESERERERKRAFWSPSSTVQGSKSHLLEVSAVSQARTTPVSCMCLNVQVVYVHLQRLVMTPYGTIAKLRVSALPVDLLPQCSTCGSLLAAGIHSGLWRCMTLS